MRRAVRLIAATAAVGLTLVAAAGGCGAGDPAPAPEPHYGQPPRDLCDRLRLADLFGQFDLDLTPSHELAPDYRTQRTYWRVRCSFAAQAADARYATAFGVFQPGGGVQVRVYHDAASAEDAYDQEVDNVDLRVATIPGTSATTLPGWWGESGSSEERAVVLDPADFDLGDFAATQVQVVHLIRHENLVMWVYPAAVAPTADTAEVTVLLRDLAAALVDETAAHLRG